MFQDGLRLEEFAEPHLQPSPSYATLLLSKEARLNTRGPQVYFTAAADEYLVEESPQVGNDWEGVHQELHFGMADQSQNSFEPSNSLANNYATMGPLWAMQHNGLSDGDYTYGEQGMVEDDPMQLTQNPVCSSSWQQWLEHTEHQRDIARTPPFSDQMATRQDSDFMTSLEETQEHDSGDLKETANSHSRASYVVSPGAIDFIELDEM